MPPRLRVGHGNGAIESIRKQLEQHLRREMTAEQATQFIADAMRAREFSVQRAGQLEQRHAVIPADSATGRSLPEIDREWTFDVWRDHDRPLLVGVRPRASDTPRVRWRDRADALIAHQRGVVPVTCENLAGSGFFCRNAGENHLVLTSAHVLGEQLKADRVRVDGRRVLHIGTVTWSELAASYGRRAAEWFGNQIKPDQHVEYPDLSLLVVSGNLDLPPVRFANSLTSREELVLFGLISGRRIGTAGPLQDFMDGSAGMQVQVYPGWSGGPVVNERGEIAGVVATGNPVDEEVWTYLIAADLLHAFMKLTVRKLGVHAEPNGSRGLRRRLKVIGQLLTERLAGPTRF